ncbi:MAG: uracil-DNA glycosylase [Spirochaetales bacterium]|nr:uracil-DNA glycosylase [Spirochaetales bacterium]
MDLNTVFSDYWEILNLCEDYLKGGYRSNHDPAPAFRFEVKGQDSPASSEDPEERESSSAPVEEGSLEERILQCRRCDLHLARKQAIPGRGAAQPRLLIVLPPPGYDEDEQNLPLTGEALDFLNKWLTAVGVGEDQTYRTNSVKCRTPGTRPPFSGEVDCCGAYLAEQIATLRPEAVLLLGENALSAVESGAELEQKRGKPFFKDNVFYLTTYDPASVLRDPNLKRPAWEDLKVLRDFLNHG